MTENLDYPLRQGPPPAAIFVTACEALTWIALGVCKTTHQLTANGLSLICRWGDSNLEATLTALEAAAAEHPFCAIVRSDPAMPNLYATRVLSPKGPEILQWIREGAHRRTGRLPSFVDLAAELRVEAAAFYRDVELFARARRDLVNALRTGRLKAFGLMSRRSGEAEPVAHVEIPFQVFIDPRMTVTSYDTVSVDLDANATEGKARRGTEYVDVRLSNADVLALWPLTEATDDRTSNRVPNAPLPPSAFWTIPQAIVWLRTDDLELAESYRPLNAAWQQTRADSLYPTPNFPTPGAIWQRIHYALTHGGVAAEGPDGQPIRPAYWASRTGIPYCEEAVLQSKDVRQLDNGIPVQGAAEPLKGKRHNGLDYRKVDAELIAVMHAMITGGDARSPMNAARAVVNRATGHGAEESKVRRLVLGYRQTHPTT